MATTKKVKLIQKPKPKKDGSGKGKRLNSGRGGCAPSKQPKTGRGQ